VTWDRVKNQFRYRASGPPAEGFARNVNLQPPLRPHNPHQLPPQHPARRGRPRGYPTSFAMSHIGRKIANATTSTIPVIATISSGSISVDRFFAVYSDSRS
jgi:hypothetical protein